MLKTLYKLFEQMNIKECEELGRYFNDGISLLNNFKNILIQGNTKLRQLNDVLEIADEASQEELHEAFAEIGGDFKKFSEFLGAFGVKWIDAYQKITEEVIKTQFPSFLATLRAGMENELIKA